jgi:hypothetical protein
VPGQVLGVGPPEAEGERYFRAVRLCDDVLAFLATYGGRDEVIERLELAIVDERLEAFLGARECASAPATSTV